MTGMTPDPVPAPVAVPRPRPWLGAVLLVMAASAVSQGFARFTYAFVLPAMKEDLLGSYGAAGLLGAANLGSYVVAVLVITTTSPRVEPTRLVKAGLAGVCAGLLMMAVAPGPWALAVGMVLTGASGAAVWIPASGIVAACAPVERRGLAYGLMIMGIGVTIALSGLMTGVVQDLRGVTAWREVWAVVAVLSVVILVIVTVGLKPTGRPPEAAARGLRSLRAEIPTARVFWAYGLYGVGFSIYVHYLVAALRDLGGLSSADANLAYSLLGIASIFGAVLLGRLSDHWHRSHTLGLAMAVSGACALALTATTNPWLLTGSVVLFGLVMTGIGSVLAAYLSPDFRR